MNVIDDTTAAYLAGYLERGGAVRIYINKDRDDDAPLIETSRGRTVPIESAGIYVRVRSRDMTVLRKLSHLFEGNLTKGQWQGWNEDAAVLLNAILPYLKTGKRKALVKLALEFHEFIEEMKERGMGSLLFTAKDTEAVMRYEDALKEITASE